MTTILSQCHLSTVEWIPEPGSKQARRKANHERHKRQFIKPMMWSSEERKALKQLGLYGPTMAGPRVTGLRTAPRIQ